MSTGNRKDSAQDAGRPDPVKYMRGRHPDLYDNSNPYTVQPYGGMIAYVVDSDSATWTSALGAAVEKEVGATRYGKLKIRDENHHVSRHRVDYKGRSKAVRQDVDVLHLAIEIDAKPPRR